MASPNTLLQKHIEDLTKASGLPAAQSIMPLQGDASARRYYRILTAEYSMILMDCRAIPDMTDAFTHLTQQLGQNAIPVPNILASTPDKSLIILEDFGDTTLFQSTQKNPTTALYKQASDLLIHMQSMPRNTLPNLPDYDYTRLLNEYMLFPSWFLGKHLSLDLNQQQQKMIKQLGEQLIDNALHQPQCFVHRDYHSRNLMIKSNGELGVIDYQDAVWGPVTYDWASLLKDCYLTIPHQHQLHALERGFLAYQDRIVHQQAPAISQPISAETFVRDFDYISLHRHLKVLGIFSRLAIRDSKPSFLADIPRILHYVKATCNRYAIFSHITPLIELAEVKFLDKQPTEVMA